MRRQPKARSTKSKTREAAFYELSKVARSGPKKDVKANFGDGTMMRQVCTGCVCDSIMFIISFSMRPKNKLETNLGDRTMIRQVRISI